MTEDSDCEGKASDLLDQFERILESDPLIDEIGFIHPSQFSMLNEEAGRSESSSIEFICCSDTNFWVRNHKLGISTQVLLPLYKAARKAFVGAIKEYGTINNGLDQFGLTISPCVLSSSAIFENGMKHSKAVLLLSCDFGTAWNFRKSILLKKQHLPVYMDELLLSALVLSYSPKSEHAWSYRRWVIKLIAQNFSTLHDIVTKESELVERIAERSKMNYRAWNHRCWLVSYMLREQVWLELKKTRKWAELHIADNCCFHYRRRLMLRILEDSNCKNRHESSGFCFELNQLWKEELHWNEMLIKRYIGREALWLHRRFLAQCWIKHFAADLHRISGCCERKEGTNDDLSSFINFELNLLNSCLTVPDDDFEDFQAQAVHSATYILWLMKQMPCPVEIQEKLRAGNPKTMLCKAVPEKWALWDYLDSN